MSPLPESEESVMYDRLVLPDLRVMIAEDDAQGLAEFCEVLHPAGTAEILEELQDDEIWKVLSRCPMPAQVEIFEFLSLQRRIELVSLISRKDLTRLIEEMSPDDRVDLLNRMDEEQVESLLPLIAQAERSDIRKLLSYPEHSAGSIMTTEYASLPEDITVSDAIERLRRQAPDRETIYYVYILGEGRRLDGFISLRDLILARPKAQLADIMRRDVISVHVEDDQEIVAQELAKYDFLAIPVIDSQNQLVGIVTHDDVLDVVREEADEDVYLMAGVAPLEDSYLDTPALTLAWKRGMWLLFLSCVSLMTAEVLNHYSGISDRHMWMILFLPMVLASGGNSGAQSATLIIRSLAVGDSSRVHALQLTRRELGVGGMLGLMLALIGLSAAMFWFRRTFSEAAVVGATMFLVVVMGTVSGALLPLFFRRLGMDPALMSNPLVAAVVDIMGVVTYYTVAIIFLGS